ncbi:M20/M25/M40 family metallo-hydrolase [Enterococcus pallens]|uniref:Peptidase T-like protein n=1 Tax=Enterococcus pallens ATCC BAA-351 TaxID=1158607 RepID=R2SM31_9ENTE|nr:M20/M25/M40 family metallo-hydrolase [Enterococcus pallens]EOH96210.1 peptidase T-like protein [Enterococcus pallens ATCC BAA-351]EOU14577.1 peptidase T-like protein [Enterococcus pallens ATCC BAA-351]
MKDVTELFLDLVKISSPSKQERAVADYIKDYLSHYSQLNIIEDNTGEKIGGTTGNLIVQLPGKGSKLLFDAHMDTVRPCEQVKPQITEGIIRSNGSTILGADDKSGIALMLSMIDHLVRRDLHPAITFLFTVCEEQSLQGAKQLDPSYLQEIDFAYVLDGEGPLGTAVVQTPHGCKGTLRIIGKEAHAGVCPEKGVNALVVAAEAINHIPMGRVDQETTCNIGVVHGGSATNVVMGKVEMQFEARSFDQDKLEALIDYVKDEFQRVCKINEAIFEENLSYGTPGYKINDQDDLIVPFKKACEKQSVRYQGAACGGGSNANVYRMRGINAVNLSTNMQNIHSVDETIAITDLHQMLEILLSLVEEFTN